MHNHFKRTVNRYWTPSTQSWGAPHTYSSGRFSPSSSACNFSSIQYFLLFLAQEESLTNFFSGTWRGFVGKSLGAIKPWRWVQKRLNLLWATQFANVSLIGILTVCVTGVCDPFQEHTLWIPIQRWHNWKDQPLLYFSKNSYYIDRSTTINGKKPSMRNLSQSQLRMQFWSCHPNFLLYVSVIEAHIVAKSQYEHEYL